MTNEHATQIFALMAEQVKATERARETFEKHMDSLIETVNTGFNQLGNKLDVASK